MFFLFSWLGVCVGTIRSRWGSRRRHHWLVALASLVACCWLVPVADASSIGFQTAFLSSTTPFNVVECDAQCSSPSQVKFSLVVTRSGDTSNPDTVYLSTRSSTIAGSKNATPGVDFVSLVNVPVVFTKDQTLQTVDVTVISDGVYEEDERFEAVLSNPSDGVTLSDAFSVAYINIQDGGDAGIFSFSANSYSVLENAGDVQLTILRNGGTSGNVSVVYQVVNPTQATAVTNKDFLLLDDQLTVNFVEGQHQGVVNVRIVNDTQYQPNKFFFLKLSALLPLQSQDPTKSVAKMAATNTEVVVNVLDDGDAGEFNFADKFIFCREDNGTAVVTIVRTKGSSSSSYTPVTLDVATVAAESNATQGSTMAFDYFAKSDTLTWSNGETKKYFAIKIFNNVRYQPDTRTIKVSLLKVAGGASLGAVASMWVYIIDDRDAGTFSFKLSHYEVFENATSVDVEVIRSGPPGADKINTYSSGAVSVQVATYGGTILPQVPKYDPAHDFGVVQARGCTHTSPCTAPAGVAYTPVTQTLNFAEGEVSKKVTIAIANDNVFQAPDRVFKVYLQHVTGGAHIGLDYEHPPEWDALGIHGYLLALDRICFGNDFDNVGTIVTIQDDGDPAVLFSKASVSVSEIGQVDSFSVQLNSKPSADVAITFTTDTKLLHLSQAQLTFTTTNWALAQSVQVTAIPNDETDGILLVEISFSIVSQDASYADPLRENALSATGFVLAAKIFTEKWGQYDTGNRLQAFGWDSTTNGVLTAPLTGPKIHAYILDDDYAGVTLQPEVVRHRTSPKAPETFVSVRHKGRKAVVNVLLTSKPLGSVNVMFQASIDSGVAIEPSSLVIERDAWNQPHAITVSSTPLGNNKDAAAEAQVTYSRVLVLTSSQLDAFYNRDANDPVASFLVERFPPAKVNLDASQAVINENLVDSRLEYSLTITSEPLYWEPLAGPGGYQPFAMSMAGIADTTLTFQVGAKPQDAVTAAAGTKSSISVASNASVSDSMTRISKFGAFAFDVFPSIVSTSQSARVGLAKLRLFRLSGGENRGLGGITVGVVRAKSNASMLWDEHSMSLDCSQLAKDSTVVDACGVQDVNHSYSNFLPAYVTADNISAWAYGEKAITPSGSFNALTNQYVTSSGWLEIDVTVAVNEFLAEVVASEHAEDDAFLTLVMYARPTTEFVYDGVDELVFASKDHADTSLHPHLWMSVAGVTNLAPFASASQSHSGTASAAIDGHWSSTTGVASSYAMSATSYHYPWWQADLGTVRAIEKIVIVIKRKLAPTLDVTKAHASLWVFLSATSLASASQGQTQAGFTTAQATANYQRQFNVTTRTSTASDSEVIVLTWHVFGEKASSTCSGAFMGDYNALVEARFVLLQVEGDNNVVLNEVEIYQVPLASTRVVLGGYLPSLAYGSLGVNQLKFSLDSNEDVSSTCDRATSICRSELLFTPGNWQDFQSVSISVVDDHVATGDRSVLLTHTLVSQDPDFRGSDVCQVVNGSSSQAAAFCTSTLFNESSVKPLTILDDDENKVVFSKTSLHVVEGSQVYPMAPETKRLDSISPQTVLCSDHPNVVRSMDGNTPRQSCQWSFDHDESSSWDTCVANSTAKPFEPGSAWMLADFGQLKNLTSVTMTVPKMTSSHFLKTVSVWQSTWPLTKFQSSPPLSVTNGWAFVKRFQVAMQSSARVVLSVNANDLVGLTQLVLMAFEASYDDAANCLVAPQVAFAAYEPIPFPLAVRGDTSDADSVPVATSKLSRMHLFGNADAIGMRLTSEPLKPVVISSVLHEASAVLEAFDAQNSSMGQPFLEQHDGAMYDESATCYAFWSPSKLVFDATNWNVVQYLAFTAIDNNQFDGNRSFWIDHSAASGDANENLVPLQSFDGTILTFSRGKLADPVTYATGAAFVASTSGKQLSAWPFHLDTSWSSRTGHVQVEVIDDDLPGVSISQSQVIVDEDGSSGNFSVVLDSAPTQNVVISISYVKDSTLFTAAPLMLTFTRADWFNPQFVFIHPVPNAVFDAGEPFTISYNRLIPKANQPILVHRVASADPNYDGIQVGQNEPRGQSASAGKALYADQQGVKIVVLDNDTGCKGEYSCGNKGQCVEYNDGSASCQCPEGFGLKDCSARCQEPGHCEFIRYQFLLRCMETDDEAICVASPRPDASPAFSPSRLAGSLFAMLSNYQFVSSTGKSFGKLYLRNVSQSVFVVNSTSAKCLGFDGNCVKALVDVSLLLLESSSSSTSTSDDLRAKLQGFQESGDFQKSPYFMELVTRQDTYVKSVGTTVVVWLFIGFCIAAVLLVVGLFVGRWVHSKKMLVTPQQVAFAPDDDKELTPFVS